MIAALSARPAVEPRAPTPAPAHPAGFGKAMDRAQEDRPAREKPAERDGRGAGGEALESKPSAVSTNDPSPQPAEADPLANAQAMLAALAGQAGTGKPPSPRRATAGPDEAGAAVATAIEGRLAASAKPASSTAPLDGAGAADAAPGAGDGGADFGQMIGLLAPAPDKAMASAADGADPGGAAPLAEAAIAHHLDLARDGAWLDRLAKDIAASADQSGQLRFSLAPERLGRLEVALAQSADGTAIRLTTETREAQRIIADAQPQLVAEARAQGLRISETSVDLNNGGGGGGQPQAFGNQNARGEGQQPHRAAPWQAPDAQARAIPATRAAPGGDELYA